MAPLSTCVLVISSAGRYGSEIDDKKLRTRAMPRKMTPGTQKARDIIAVPFVKTVGMSGYMSGYEDVE